MITPDPQIGSPNWIPTFILTRLIYTNVIFQTQKKIQLKFLLKIKYALFIAENGAFRPDLGKTELYWQKKTKKRFKIQNLETFTLFFNFISDILGAAPVPVALPPGPGPFCFCCFFVGYRSVPHRSVPVDRVADI